MFMGKPSSPRQLGGWQVADMCILINISFSGDSGVKVGKGLYGVANKCE